MACISTTWTPTSLQLRLALNFGSHRKSQAVRVRARFNKLDRDLRVLCLSSNGEERRDASSWNGLDSTSDTLAGWSASDVGEKNSESRRNRSLGGVVGIGLVASILVAGLSFAALSLSKRNISRDQLQMKALSSQGEVLLESDEATSENKNCVKEKREGNEKHGGGTVGNSTRLECELSVAQNYDKSFGGNDKLENDNEKPLEGIEALNYSHSEKKHESSSMPFSGEIFHSEAEFSEPSTVVVSSSSLGEPVPENGENLVDPESTVLLPMENLENRHNDSFPIPVLEATSDTISSSAYTLPDSPVEPLASASMPAGSVPTSLFLSSENAISATSTTVDANPDLNKLSERSTEIFDGSNVKVDDSHTDGSKEATRLPLANLVPRKVEARADEIGEIKSSIQTPHQGNYSDHGGVPAPFLAAETRNGKVLIPTAVDQLHGQTFAALNVLKIIESDAQPTDLCTRREYARWLVSASSVLSRNTTSKVYPAMYIENVTDLAFDDISPDDPDFQSIQGLAEAGLISSKLSNGDLLGDYQGHFVFSPESLVSRQDLISWKMAVDKRQLPAADRKTLYQLSGFIDIDKIHPDAWPALISDLAAGEQGITALAFGCTRLFQPDKPVTKAQAAVALASGEAFDLVSEELARIEAESIAEKAVSAHNALVAEVEKDINANFEEVLLKEREKIEAVEKMAEQARSELEKLRTQREEENLALIKERAMIESEMEVFSRLRRDVEEQLESLMSNKAEIAYEKERINKLRKEAEEENEQISRLQYELEVERKALSMARTWAEDEAKRAREQAKALKDARSYWESCGLKVVVDDELQEDSAEELTWLNAGKRFSVEGTAKRAESLVEKLKVLAKEVGGKSQEIIKTVIEKIDGLISALKEQIFKASRKAEEMKNSTSSKAVKLKDASLLKLKESAEEFQRGTLQVSVAVRNSMKRVAEDCREGVEKFGQKFKT